MAGAKVGGAERFFERLVPALTAAGVEQTAVIRRHAERAGALRKAGVPTLELGFGGPFDLATRLQVPLIARSFRPDLTLAWMNRAALRMPTGPWVRAARLGGYYDLKYYRRCQHLIANTADIARWLGTQGWPAERVHVLPNFVDPPSGRPVPRGSLYTSADQIVLLCLGRLHPNKAFDIAIRALADAPRAVLWLAGSGPEEARLRALAASTGVADRVRWLGWRSDVGALLQTADILLCPSRHEPLGNVVIEAWAAGTPVIAVASAGPAGLIRDGVDGRLVPIDDVAQLAEAIRALGDQPDVRARLAHVGLGRFRADFSQAVVVQAYCQLFERLMQGQR